MILLESNIFCQAEIGHDWKHVIGRPKDTELRIVLHYL